MAINANLDSGKVGAPYGNQNARKHLSDADKASYTKRIVGKTTSDGVGITGFSDHAFDRIAQRNITKGKIEEMLQSESVSLDKNYPDSRKCYDISGKRLVLDYTDGTIVTIEKRRQNK